GFTMVGGLQSGPSLPQLAETFRLADAAGSSRRRTMPGAGRRSTTTGARSARRPARARHDRRRLDRAAAAAGCAYDEAGYDGPVEVEIFTAELWARPGVEVLRQALGRWIEHVV
ncbi:MAG TPA: hypothetical protein VGJ44_16480, partial [Kribbellaceae bacterium]